MPTPSQAPLRQRQLRVALTGGVGSGKSALGAALERLGAVRIDADQVARDVVAPTTPGLAAVVARFGPEVLTADDSLDRAALARLVFTDDAARADLNAIVHPLVQLRSEQLMNAAPPDSVVVYEVPLLVETGRTEDFDVVVVVQSDLERRISRLQERGLSGADAQARIAAQADDEQRLAISDELVHNDGSFDELAQAAQLLWGRLQRRLSDRTGTP